MAKDERNLPWQMHGEFDMKRITITHIDCSKTNISCENYTFEDGSYIIKDKDDNNIIIVPERNILIMRVKDEL